jgi:hypothetical protein
MNSIIQEFPLGEVMSFRMTTPISLGMPTVLHIWQDFSGSGKDKTWHLAKVVIVNKSSNKWFVL